MDYQKESIKALKTVSKTNRTGSFDWDIIVPDSKPDVASIISTDGIVNILSKEVMQDRAIINGNVKITILYISSDEQKSVKSIECVQSFNYVLELNGLRQNMLLSLNTFLKKISSDVLNSRKINISSSIDFYAACYNDEEISYIEDINDENIKCNFMEIDTLMMTSYFEKAIPFSENSEVPVGKSSIKEILKSKCEFSKKEIKNANNKLILRGNILVSTVYLSSSDEDTLQYMTDEIPVNEIIDCENLNEDSILDYDVEIGNYNYILKDNSDKESRIIKFSANITVKGKIYEKLKINPIIDLYSLKNNLSTDLYTYNYDEILCNESGQFTLKETVALNNKKDIQKILLIELNHEILNLENYNNVKVGGTIPVSLLYLSTDGELCSYNYNAPFSHAIELDKNYCNSLCDFKMEIDSFSYNIVTSDEIEIRVNMNYKLRMKNNISQSIIQSVEIKEKCMDCKHNLTVFFCDGNEKLWDIAKKYKSTINDILLANELDENVNIVKGMKLLIP